jgi:hypothetical protein
MRSLPSASTRSAMRTPPAANGLPRRMRMMVTPELAKQWLEANTHNRPLSEELVIAYMVDMLDGRWQYNGDAIRFDHTGRLIDGQHRLHACIEAGVPFETDSSRAGPLMPSARSTSGGCARQATSRISKASRMPALPAPSQDWPCCTGSTASSE